MSRCTNTILGDKLYAYEVGMLTDDDRREIEIHLLECPYCHERVLQFQEAATLLRYDPDVRETIGELAEGYSGAESQAIAVTVTRKRRITLIPASVAAAALLLFLILKPWQIEFKSSKEAVAAENRLAIVSFNNLVEPTDSQKIGEITANLLTASLSESHSLQVVSSQRIHDILKLLGKEETGIVNRQLASEVAAAARARWIVTGSIVQMRPRLIVSAQVADVSTGTIVGSQSVTADSTETIFAIADKLAIGIKRDLRLPGHLPQEGPSVADVTTHSAEAYYHYIRGVDYYYKQYESEAVECFEKALHCDSSFAMAYYYLAALDFTSRRDSLMSRAVAFADKATWKEQHYIRSGAALMSGDFSGAATELRQLLARYPDEKSGWYRLGACQYYQQHFQEAITSFDSALALDSLYKEPYNFLAYAYDRIGNAEMSILAINKYIALAPEQASPYNSRGDLCALNGRLDDAIRSYQRALEIKPDFWQSLDALGIMSVFKGDYPQAESCFQALSRVGDKVFRAAARNDQAYVLIHQGRFQQTLNFLRGAISQDLSEGLAECANYKRLMMALAYAEQGRLDKGISELGDYVASTTSPSELQYYPLDVRLLTDSGDTAAAAVVVEKLLSELKNANADSSLFWCATGFMEEARGRTGSALSFLEKSTRESRGFLANYNLALAYLNTKRLGDAVAGFEKLTSVYTPQRLLYGTYNVKVHYYLGIAYEESNWNEKAIEQYQMFLNIWKNADPGIGAVTDAKARLARLISPSRTSPHSSL